MQNNVKWKSQIKKVEDPEIEKLVPTSAYNEALDKSESYKPKWLLKTTETMHLLRNGYSLKTSATH